MYKGRKLKRMGWSDDAAEPVPGHSGQGNRMRLRMGEPVSPVHKGRLSVASVTAVTATKEPSAKKWVSMCESNHAPCVPIVNDWTREDAQYLTSDAAAHGNLFWKGCVYFLDEMSADVSWRISHGGVPFVRKKRGSVLSRVVA